jgi:hypothetical protein
MRGEVVARPPVSLATHVDRYLDVHASTRDPNTIRVLRERLRRPVGVFGDTKLRDLERMASEIAAWQATLPERSRYGIMQALEAAAMGRHRTQPCEARRLDVRLAGARRRRQCVRVGSDHGEERADDRTPLRRPGAGLRRRDPRQTRRLPRWFGQAMRRRAGGRFRDKEYWTHCGTWAVTRTHERGCYFRIMCRSPEPAGCGLTSLNIWSGCGAS